MSQLIPTRVGTLRVDVQDAGDHLPAALLWHSLFVDERSWERVVPYLSRDRRLINVRGPGHGGSGDAGHRYSILDCAEAALEILDMIGVQGPVDWVGNAWGGHVGIVFAASHPDRIRTLVTAGTPVHPYPLSGRLSTQAMVAVYRLLGPVGYLTNAVVEALLSESTRAEDTPAADLVRDSFMRADRHGMANAVVSISLRRPDLTPLLPEVQVPTLFITGSDHPDWSPEQVRAAAALLPRGSSHVIDRAAYLVPLEAPAEFSGCVREFWAIHPAGAARVD